MLKNYVKTALRNLLKNKTYSVLNISGLAIGFASCILILLYVRHEMSYDRFHSNAERTFRIGYEVSLGSGSKVIASSPYRLAPALITDFPELERVTHFSRQYTDQVEYEDKQFRESRITFADSQFFDVFNFKFVAGDAPAALRKSMQVVVSQSIAQKYFGEAVAIGKILNMGAPYGDEKMHLTVAGVIEDMPDNSHFHHDFIVSMISGNTVFPKSIYRNWGWDSQYTYVVLPENKAAEEFRKELVDFGSKHISGDWFIKFFAQDLTDIHLHSDLNSEIEANGDMNYVQIFAIVAVIILLIACVNYMNLATARSSKRSKEVGVRKAIGGQRQQIFTQFLGESTLIVLVSFLLALVIASLSLPLFNGISGKNITPTGAESFVLSGIFFGIALLVGLVSGSYPALYLSSFKPVKVLKEGVAKISGGALFVRKGLVTLQFTISIMLIVGTLVVIKQLHYLRSKKLGANTEQVLIFPAQTNNIRSHFNSFRTEMMRDPSITGVTTSDRRMGRDINHGEFMSIENEDQTLSKGRISTVIVGWNFFDLYDIEMVSGRAFSRQFAADTSRNAAILNEAAAEVLGLDPNQCIGRRFKVGRDTGTIVGIMRDFHFESLYNTIKPMMFFVDPEDIGYVSVKLSGEDLQATLAHIKTAWSQFEPERIFYFYFLEEELFALYMAEERFLTVFTVFSALAIFTGCLGIFGLASFTALQRSKEIGIRKVLGASIANVVVLLAKEMTLLVLLAFVIAIPISFQVMNDWLQNFAYRTSFGLTIFLVSGIAALFIAWFTVSFQSIKAAVANPVDSLKYE